MPSRAKRALRRLVSAVYPLYAQHFTRAALVAGTPAHGGPPMRCLFLGSTEFNRFFEDRIYAAPPAVRQRSRLWIPRAPTLLAATPPPFDLCVADVPLRHARLFEASADVRTGPMVLQHVDLSSDWVDRKSFPRQARQLVRKHGFTSTLSREPADCRWFYERMYLPHARAQFGVLANLSPLADLEKKLKQGYLFFVNAAGQRVAGALSFVEGDTVTGYKLGVLDGDRRYVSQGAISAVYLFDIEFARQRGCRRLDLESSRPLLDDRVFVYKRRWGATVRAEDRPASRVYLFFANRSAEFVSPFLLKNPLIVHSPEGLRGLVAVPAEDALDAAREQELKDHYYSPGLAGLTIVTTGLDEARTIRY